MEGKFSYHSNVLIFLECMADQSCIFYDYLRQAECQIVVMARLGTVADREAWFTANATHNPIPDVEAITFY